jgi:hypothetical protein
MKAKEERDKLEKLIEGAEDTLRGNTPNPLDIPELQSEPTFDIDYDQLQKDCDKQAKKLLKGATGLMIGDEMTKGNSYLKEKIKTDVISLAGMLYQMELFKTIQKDMMEEVKHGAKHPRMYEVFTTVGKNISENNKQLLQTVEAIKETYINLKQNIMERNDDAKKIGDGGLQRTDSGLIAMGSRELIQDAKRLRLLRKSTPKTDISDAEIEK